MAKRFLQNMHAVRQSAACMADSHDREQANDETKSAMAVDTKEKTTNQTCRMPES